MAQLYPVAGCKIYIGNAAMDDQDDDFIASDFASVTWVEIKGWTDMGSIGDSSQLITSDQINTARTKKAKGTKNAGSMENVFDIIPDDPGQIALLAAAGVQTNYPFRIDMNDAVAAGDPSKRMFVGLVMTAQERGGGANTPRKVGGTVEINSNIVKVAAT